MHDKPICPKHITGGGPCYCQHGHAIPGDEGGDWPKPPPGPPGRSIRTGLLGSRETKESIRAREDYETYMRGWRDGWCSGKAFNKRIHGQHK